MVSHNKEADQTVNLSENTDFLAGKTFTGIPSISNKTLKANKKWEDHGCIAYIPILDIVETRNIILSNNICDVQRHWYAG